MNIEKLEIACKVDSCHRLSKLLDFKSSLCFRITVMILFDISHGLIAVLGKVVYFEMLYEVMSIIFLLQDYLVCSLLYI